MSCYVYIIKNNDDDLYVGITENLNNRLYSHNTNQGSVFTKNKEDFKIVFKEEYETLTEARGREVQIKKWRRNKKKMLIKRYSLRLPTKQ